MVVHEPVVLGRHRLEVLLLCFLPRAANTGEAVRRAKVCIEASLEAQGRESVEVGGRGT